MSVSNAFQVFAAVAPESQATWMEAAQKLGKASALDPKTQHLCYISVLAAARLETGIPFHVKLAKTAGATREEVISAILVGLPAVGNAVVQALPPAIAAFDS
jgi:alkylhydroperoxidase/carboxymuconolactone decarboxylase family protein YurZ